MVRDRGGWRRGQEEGREREGGAEVELRTWRWGLRGGGSEGEVSAQRQGLGEELEVGQEAGPGWGRDLGGSRFGGGGWGLGGGAPRETLRDRGFGVEKG